MIFLFKCYLEIQYCIYTHPHILILWNALEGDWLHQLQLTQNFTEKIEISFLHKCLQKCSFSKQLVQSDPLSPSLIGLRGGCTMWVVYLCLHSNYYMVCTVHMSNFKIFEDTNSTIEKRVLQKIKWLLSPDSLNELMHHDILSHM